MATASCGICGKASIDEVEVRCAPIPAGPVVAAATIVGLPARLRAEHAVLDPFDLKKQIEEKLKKFFTVLGHLNREATKP